MESGGALKQEDNPFSIHCSFRTYEALLKLFTFVFYFIFIQNGETRFFAKTRRSTFEVFTPTLCGSFQNKGNRRGRNYSVDWKAGKYSLRSLKCCKAKVAFSSWPCNDRSAHSSVCQWKWCQTAHSTRPPALLFAYLYSPILRQSSFNTELFPSAGIYNSAWTAEAHTSLHSHSPSQHVETHLFKCTCPLVPPFKPNSSAFSAIARLCLPSVLTFHVTHLQHPLPQSPMLC